MDITDLSQWHSALSTFNRIKEMKIKEVKYFKVVDSIIISSILIYFNDVV